MVMARSVQHINQQCDFWQLPRYNLIWLSPSMSIFITVPVRGSWTSLASDIKQEPDQSDLRSVCRASLSEKAKALSEIKCTLMTIISTIHLKCERLCVFVLQTPRLLAGNKTDLHMEERCCLSSHTVPFWLTQAQRSTPLSASFTTKTLCLSRAALYQMLMSPRAPEIFFFISASFWSESFHPAALIEFQICFIFVHVSNTKEMGEVSICLFLLQSVWSGKCFVSGKTEQAGSLRYAWRIVANRLCPSLFWKNVYQN